MDERGGRDWQVLLLGGASGTGKSFLSYPLARRYQVPIVEVDDLVVAVQATTTPEQQPTLHYWDTNPDAQGLTLPDIAELHLAVASVLQPALEAVIGNHLESGTPVIIEGDYLLPALAVRESFAGQPADGRVRAVFLHESDTSQLVANYLVREPDEGEQRGRAEVSVLLGERWAAEAAELSVPVVAARPWVTTLTRLCAHLDEPAPTR